jgi:hypothetical protein
MKKLIQIFVIISVIVFTGMQSASAQAQVHVEWTLGQSSCICHTLQDSVYSVEIWVVDECAHPPTSVYYDVESADGGDLDKWFTLAVDCDPFNNEPCYRVYAKVTKYCPDGHGGFTFECDGQSSKGPYTCAYLKNNATIIQIDVIVD